MGWDMKKLCTQLSELCQLDIDAVGAYEQAIEKIDIEEIREKISGFKADHERHVMDLSEAIRRFGEAPPERKPDIKGFFIKGFTALRSITGTEGALKAMRGNEKLTNKTYEDALQWDMPEDIRSLIEKNYADERRHLLYIESALQAGHWTEAEASGPGVSL